VLSDHGEAIVLAAIVAVGAAIRFGTLGVQSLDHDETVTVARVLQPSLEHTLRVVTHLERSPPLYYISAWLWTKLLGAGPLHLRALSALVGTLTIPAAYLVGRELASRRAGLVAAALVALNPFLIWYSQEARSYALLVFFSTVALFYLARALHDPRRRNLALWALASALALLSHYFAVFLIAPEGIWLIAALRPRRPPIVAVGATAAVGLALLPLAHAQESIRAHGNNFTGSPVVDRAWQAVLHYVSSVEPRSLTDLTAGVQRIEIVAGAAGFVLALAAVALLRRRSDGFERRGALLAAGVGAASLALPIGLALAGVDYVETRNLVGSVVPLLVAAGIAFGSRRAGGLGLGAAAATCALFAGVVVAVTVIPQMQRPNWRDAANAIGPRTVTRVVVAPHLAQVPFIYYLHARDFTLGDAPVRTQSLDVLSTKDTITPPHRPLRLVGRQRIADAFWLWRYRSARPVLVHPSAVNGDRILHQRANALITGPRRQASSRAG